jgi:hypothetical protein
MRNITVTVSDQTYRQARIWAAQRDTAVSAVVQYLLQTLPGIARATTAFPVAKPPQNEPAAAQSEPPSIEKNAISTKNVRL